MSNLTNNCLFQANRVPLVRVKRASIWQFAKLRKNYRDFFNSISANNPPAKLCYDYLKTFGWIMIFALVDNFLSTRTPFEYIRVTYIWMIPLGIGLQILGLIVYHVLTEKKKEMDAYIEATKAMLGNYEECRAKWEALNTDQRAAELTKVFAAKMEKQLREDGGRWYVMTKGSEGNWVLSGRNSPDIIDAQLRNNGGEGETWRQPTEEEIPILAKEAAESKAKVCMELDEHLERINAYMISGLDL